MASVNSLIALLRMSLIDPRLSALAYQIKKNKRTYLSYSTLFSLARNVVLAHRRNTRPVQVAEFGVGRGGSASILAWMVNRFEGSLSLFDIFGRIPAPTQQDGEKAIQRYNYIVQKEGEEYYGNIDNLLDLIRKDLYKVCSAERIEFIRGKYEDTLPDLVNQQSYDVIHIDCDWYESSKAVYAYLKSRLNPGAIIQVDDFSNWKGSKQAFEEEDWLTQYQTHIVDGALVIDTAKKR